MEEKEITINSANELARLREIHFLAEERKSRGYRYLDYEKYLTKTDIGNLNLIGYAVKKRLHGAGYVEFRISWDFKGKK